MSTGKSGSNERRRTIPLALSPSEAAFVAEVPRKTVNQAAWQRVRERVTLVQRARAAVASDPEVGGGELVVRGTRIPVYLLADSVKRGETAAQLLEDYPALTEEMLDGALLYAHLHPRRGRPKAAPWRKRSPRRIYRQGELGAGSS